MEVRPSRRLFYSFPYSFSCRTTRRMKDEMLRGRRKIDTSTLSRICRDWRISFMESLLFISSFVRISIGLPFIALNLSHLRRGEQEINKKKPQCHRYIKWAKTSWYITYNFYFCISSFYHTFNNFIILLLIILTNIEFLPLFDSPSCVLLMNAMLYIMEPYEKYLCIILKFISFRVWSGRSSWSDCFYMYNTNANRNCDEI